MPELILVLRIFLLAALLCGLEGLYERRRKRRAQRQMVIFYTHRPTNCNGIRRRYEP